MRKCIRCGIEMLEGSDIKEPMYGHMLRVTSPETLGVMPKDNFGNMKAAVSPKCGYVEIYVTFGQNSAV